MKKRNQKPKPATRLIDMTTGEVRIGLDHLTNNTTREPALLVRLNDAAVLLPEHAATVLAALLLQRMDPEQRDSIIDAVDAGEYDCPCCRAEQGAN